MKKNKFIFIIISILLTAFLVTSCNTISADDEHQHSYAMKSNETKHWKECECGEKSEEGSHSFGNWNTTKEPTEETTGTKERECGVCHYKETNTISALSHTHNYSTEWTIDVEPTCTVEGSKSHHCQGCDGKTDITSIPANGHSFGEWATVVEPTEETTGTKERECSVCHYKETETIPVLSHVHNYSTDWAIDVEPTCTVEGSKSHHCLGCDEKKDITSIEKKAHTYGEWTVTKNPTEEIEGSKERECSVCHHKEIETIPVLDKPTEGLEFIPNEDKKSYAVSSIGIAKDINIIIPSVFNNLPVTSIGESAFRSCSSLTSITIPESVTIIGKYAFYDCRSLTNVYYYGMIEGWCDISFSVNYSNPMQYASHFYMRNSNYDWEEVTNIEIPNTITRIGDSQFYGFNKVKSITIPSSVTSIGWGAFKYCSSLTSITIPNSVTDIQPNVFAYCNNLSSVCYNGIIEDWCNIIFDSGSSNPMSSANHFYIRNSNNEWEEVTSIEIPNTITKIGDNQFYGFSNVLSIAIPASVTSIGESAFSRCSNLTSVIIPDSVTSIGMNAFYGCSDLQKSKYYDGYYVGNIDNPYLVLVGVNSSMKNCEIHPNTKIIVKDSGLANCQNIITATIPAFAISYIPKEKLEEVIITCGDSIEPEAFWDRNLKSVTIGDSVTSIGRNAFSGCSNLTNVTIGKGVKVIGGYAFSGCSSLTSILIPDNITSIGECAFVGCTNLKYHEYNGACYLGNDDNPYLCLMKINDASIISYEINEKVKCILGTFTNCNSLTSITIPNSVTSIGDDAFRFCSSLKSVYYKGTIEDWCNIVFDYDSSFDRSLSNPMQNASQFYLRNSNAEWEEVTSIKIPNTITEIGKYQFYGFNHVTSITISDSVTRIGSKAFYNCSKLTNVYYDGTMEDWCNITFSDEDSNPMYYASHFYLKNTNKEWKEVTSIEVPYEITKIGNIQFCGFNNVTSITIPESVTSIEYDAFSGCSSLTSVTIPNSVISIGRDAFSGCSSLTSVTIPNSVTSIGYSAFQSCSNVTSVTIGNGVTSIDNYAFSGCGNLTNVYYEGTIEDWCNITFSSNCDDCTPNPMCFASCFYLRNSNNEWEEVTRIEIPSTITKIGDIQFYGFNNVVSVTMPDSVTSIGGEAFRSCSDLSSVTIGNSVTIIEYNAFSDCYRLVEVYNLSSLNIAIGSEGHGKVGYYAKVIHTSLEEQSSFIIKDDYLFIKDKENKYCLVRYSGTITELVLPNDMDGHPYEISNYAFRGCTSLTSITIPDSVTCIGDSAFWYCPSLTSITIPDSVTSIGDSAFWYCTSLTSILIPNSVTSIGDSAFYQCHNLKEVYYNGTSTEWTNITINSNNSYLTSATIYYYSENEPVESGNYWHYVDSVPTAW